MQRKRESGKESDAGIGCTEFAFDRYCIITIFAYLCVSQSSTREMVYRLLSCIATESCHSPSLSRSLATHRLLLSFTFSTARFSSAKTLSIARIAPSKSNDRLSQTPRIARPSTCLIAAFLVSSIP